MKNNKELNKIIETLSKIKEQNKTFLDLSLEKQKSIVKLTHQAEFYSLKYDFKKCLELYKQVLSIIEGN